MPEPDKGISDPPWLQTWVRDAAPRYGFQWVSDDEPEAPQPLEQELPSPDYVPDPEHPPSLDYVHGPEYPEYLVPSNNEVLIKDRPLLIDASPTALSSGYVADFDPLKEDPKEDPTEYPADGGDDDDDDDEEEEEHLASADSTTLTTVDPVPLAEDTEAFEIEESTPTPPSLRLRKAMIYIRPQTPMAAATEALIAAVAAALPSSSPPPSPLTPLSSPLS
nr:hypothetical protein [Tanacetum cinerariifolium]